MPTAASSSRRTASCAQSSTGESAFPSCSVCVEGARRAAACEWRSARCSDGAGRALGTGGGKDSNEQSRVQRDTPSRHGTLPDCLVVVLGVSARRCCWPMSRPCSSTWAAPARCGWPRAHPGATGGHRSSSSASSAAWHACHWLCWRAHTRWMSTSGWCVAVALPRVPSLALPRADNLPARTLST